MVSPAAILKRYWGYDGFRPLQADIIESVIAGHDTLGLMPTGGGKSITFQVPTMMHDGLTLVVTPIVSLMKDQCDALVKRRIKAAYLHAGLTRAESRRVIENCLYGNYKFLYISPERLSNDYFISYFRQMPVRFIVVDEAHCISQWGYDFRPSFLHISKARAIFPAAPVLALTASATAPVADDIIARLEFRPGFQRFAQSFSRPNIVYVARNTEDKMGQMLRVLSNVGGSAIVYVRSRRKTKEIADWLTAQGIRAVHYHAGLSTEEKADKQNRWKDDEIRVIVATNAFGMGIDKPDVRVVIHYDLPTSLEEYYQEAGRAGRDGRKAYAVLLAAGFDKATLHRKLTEMFPPKEFIRKVYELLGNFLDVPVGEGYGNTYEFNFSMFCKVFELPKRQALSALKILSQATYIDFIEEIDTQARVLIVARKEELYNIRTENRDVDPVLQMLLRSYTGLFADYVFINEDTLAYKLGMTADRIYSALIELGRLHLIHYVPRKRTPFIVYLTSRELPAHVLIPRSCYEERQAVVKRRMDAMEEYAFADGCRENFILRYFNEQRSEGCDHCDYCIAERQNRVAEGPLSLENGVKYMLSNGARTLDEMVATLSHPRQAIVKHLRELLDEGVVTYDEASGRFTLPK